MGERRPDAPTPTGHPAVVTPTLLREWPLPDPRGTKDAKGRLVVVGGSVSTPGAVLLAAEAAMRVGAGKVQVATTRQAAVALAVALPEAFVLGLDDGRRRGHRDRRRRATLELCDGADAVLLGPGIGAPEAASALLEGVVPHLDVPVVIDALGTAYLTEHRDGVRHLADRALLTPNATELSKVLDEEPADVDDDVLGATRRACDRNRCDGAVRVGRLVRRRSRTAAPGVSRPVLPVLRQRAPVTSRPARWRGCSPGGPLRPRRRRGVPTSTGARRNGSRHPSVGSASSPVSSSGAPPRAG